MRYPVLAGLITSSIAMHGYLALQAPAARAAFEDSWGMTPAYVASAPAAGELVTLVTSLFIHQSVLELALCIGVLAVLGARVERRIGSIGFLGFFVISGALGNLARAVVSPGVIVPLFGSEAGVLGVVAAFAIERLSERRPGLHAAGSPGARFVETAS